MFKTYYYFTNEANLSDIAENGIRPGQDGLVRLCADALDAFELGLQDSITEDYDYFAVIPTLVDPDALTEHQTETFFCIVPITYATYPGTIDTDHIDFDEESIMWYSQKPTKPTNEHLPIIDMEVLHRHDHEPEKISSIMNRVLADIFKKER